MGEDQETSFEDSFWKLRFNLLLSNAKEEIGLEILKSPLTQGQHVLQRSLVLQSRTSQEETS